MGKRLEDLDLSDEPLDDDRWLIFVDDIDVLRASGEYDWADDTLVGIQETVTRTHVVTEGQRRAVTNIRQANRGGEPRWGRRYEGYK